MAFELQICYIFSRSRRKSQLARMNDSLPSPSSPHPSEKTLSPCHAPRTAPLCPPCTPSLVRQFQATTNHVSHIFSGLYYDSTSTSSRCDIKIDFSQNDKRELLRSVRGGKGGWVWDGGKYHIFTHNFCGPRWGK